MAILLKPLHFKLRNALCAYIYVLKRFASGNMILIVFAHQKKLSPERKTKLLIKISNGLSTDQTGFLKNGMRVLVYKYLQANNNVYYD